MDSEVLTVSAICVRLQGIVGAIPWNALVFMTLYLQLLGFTDFQSSLLSAIFLGGTALGGALRACCLSHYLTWSWSIVPQGTRGILGVAMSAAVQTVGYCRLAGRVCR